jgi:DNA-binding NtrC family response regulator
MPLVKVMLVDDEIPFVETMAKRLSKRDLAVVQAFSAHEALHKLGVDNQIDIVILDVRMPGMDGVQALREIKRAYPLVEVIMLTGHATVESAIEGMKLGAHDYLMKPCDMDRLMGKIAEAAAKKAAQEEKILEARLKEIAMGRAG